MATRFFGHTSPVARRDTAFLSAFKRLADAGELQTCGSLLQTGRGPDPPQSVGDEQKLC